MIYVSECLTHKSGTIRKCGLVGGYDGLCMLTPGCGTISVALLE